MSEPIPKPDSDDAGLTLSTQHSPLTTHHSPLTTHHSALIRVVRLARKELREILRDRRTIITLIAMPLLLYPLMSVAFQQFYLASRDTAKTEAKARIGVITEKEGEIFRARLAVGAVALDRANDKDAQPFPKIVQIDKLEPTNDVEREARLIELKEKLDEGALDLIVAIPPAPPGKTSKKNALKCQVYSIATSFAGRRALAQIESLLAAANEADLQGRLDVHPRLTMLSLERISLKGSASDGAISLAALVPLVLILMTITGAVYPAIDLTAGERERGTLEILVAAPVPRFELLTAKYISVVTVSVLTAVVNLVCMTITLRWSGLGAVLIQGGLSVGLLLQVFALLLLFAAFFSAVLLCLTSFARSFKEAQAYLIPLMLASLAPGILAMLPGLELSGALIVLPLVNIVLLARDLFGSGADPGIAAFVILTTLLYALAALSLAARVFGAESVLYSEQSGWSDLLRRPESPQQVPSIPAMLWCVALMVPIQFALLAAVRSVGAIPPMIGLFLGTIINVVLFGCLPMLFVYLGRIELASGFNVSLPRVAAWIGAVVLGFSIWPIELWLLSKSSQAAVLEQHLGPVLEQMRNLGWGGLVIVIVPAILEEAFFRGLLFNALKAHSGPLVTIGVTGVLFGLTHILLPGSIGLERLIPSTLLGIVLGIVCWHTGSLWPSMVQHVLHNAILFGVAQLDTGSTQEVPLEWLAAGLAGVVPASMLLWQWGRKPVAA